MRNSNTASFPDSRGTASTMTAAAPADEGTRAEQAPRRSRLLLARQWLRLDILLSMLFLLVVLACAIGAPWIAPYDPFHPQIRHRLEGPGSLFWLGTDDLGRDMLSRLIFGARTALIASLESVSVGVALGVTAGLLAGYIGGWLDRIAMRLADVMQSIPAVLLALALIGVLGKGLGNAMLAVGLIFAVSFMRITRAVVLSERERLYVDAARVLGLAPMSIMLRQILPNVAGPLIVQASISLGTALLIEAMLSFLGVGADSTQVSWGSMLETARQFQSEQPLLPLVPGLAITLSVLSFNLLGDALRDALLPGQGAAPVARRKGLASGIPGHPAAMVDEPVALPSDTLLAVRGLTVRAVAGDGEAELLSGVSLHVRRGEILGLVGESGCGKSMTASAILGLLPRGAHVAGGSVRLGDTELIGLPEAQLREVRGRRIGMVFQDPNAALSPVHTIGTQLCDILRAHRKMTQAEALKRAAELLDLVGVPDPVRRLEDYPHQFSGGMAQRVVIAGALACDPELLIADEPTTALDVTIQAQVLDLLAELRQRLGMSVLLITHDLGVVADLCDRVAVMYAGQVVEVGRMVDTLAAPRHPYTAALLRAMPRSGTAGRALATIAGRVPPAWAWPQGCRFNPRCTRADNACRAEPIALVRGVRCVHVQQTLRQAVADGCPERVLDKETA